MVALGLVKVLEKQCKASFCDSGTIFLVFAGRLRLFPAVPAS
jgi:hypothetical protein